MSDSPQQAGPRGLVVVVALLSMLGPFTIDTYLPSFPDIEADPEHQHQGMIREIGWRSGLFVPMLRDGNPIGVVSVTS